MTRGVNIVFARKFTMEANERVRTLAERLYKSPPTGIREIVPGLVTLYVEYERALVSRHDVLSWVKKNLSLPGPRSDRRSRLIEVPVSYGGNDLNSVSKRLQMAPEKIISIHSSTLYTVLTIGFSPGQPYLGVVKPAIEIPRKTIPVPHVPAYSVGIANYYTSITAFAQPTGWDVLGQALIRIYDPHRGEPALLRPGDTVKFLPASGQAPSEPESLPLLPREPVRPFLKVLEEGLLDLVVDHGRFMVGREGLPRGGPLDRRSYSLANSVIGNPPGTAAVEINYRGPVLEATSDGIVAFAGWGLRPEINGIEADSFTGLELLRGDVLTFKPSGVGARGYLGIIGGVESRRFRGSASVGLRGRIGQPIKTGDFIGKGSDRRARARFGFVPPKSRPSRYQVLRILPGPQASNEAIHNLTCATFTAVSGDRMGVRLKGPHVLGGEVVSEAVPLGAIQVPPGGTPILLLNDRGTTGGYSKPAVVHPSDLPLAGQITAGTQVRFVLHHMQEPIYEELDQT